MFIVDNFFVAAEFDPSKNITEAKSLNESMGAKVDSGMAPHGTSVGVDFCIAIRCG